MSDPSGGLRLERYCFKLYATDPGAVALDEFVPVFHRWIQARTVEGLLIDVANYAHVPEGPGVVLIGHEADYYMDHGEGPPGLLYSRKRLAAGSNAERLRQGLSAALQACSLLENEPALARRGLRFDGRRVRFIVNDRLAAPNDDRTLEALRPDLAALLGRLWPGAAPQLARLPEDDRNRFTVDAQTASAPPVADLLARLAV